MSKINKSDTYISIFIVIFFILVFGIYILSILVSNNSSVNSYIDEISKTKKGTQEYYLTESYKNINFNWKYNLKNTNLPIALSTYTYNSFKELPRIESRDYSYYVNSKISFDSNEFDEIKMLSEQLNFIAKEYKLNEINKINFIASFVQSLNYSEDLDDYPKFPSETLYEAKGDCEDLSILLAKILSYLDYDCIIIEFNNHVGVGVNVNSTGYFLKAENKTYYYLESTSPNYKLGEIDAEYKNNTAKIFNIKDKIIIYPEYSIKKITNTNTSNSHYNIKFKLTNKGNNTTIIKLKSYLVSIYNDSKTNITDYYESKEIKINNQETVVKEYNFTYTNQTQYIIFNVIGDEINPIFMKTKKIN